MEPISCQLHCTSNVEHLSQLYTGFGGLADRGMINLNYVRSKEYKVNGKQLLTATIDGKLTLAYDTADHDGIYEEVLRNCHVYFKRSYSPKHSVVSNRILPLGLNYAVYGGHDGSLKRALWAFSENGRSSIRSKVRGVVDSSSFLSRLASDKDSGRNLLAIEAFEDFPRHDKSPIVLFLTRVWDPTESRGLSKISTEERHEINLLRVSCVRELKSALGRSFVGGLSSSDFARKNFPDCVVRPELTVKSEYLRTLRAAGICIATMGLDRSNGWKLAEYVAYAKAIVSETLHYQVTGDFEDGRNYLSFQSVSQCVENALRLFEDADECYRIKLNNYIYYHLYLRPDILVWNSLQTALSKSEAKEVISHS